MADDATGMIRDFLAAHIHGAEVEDDEDLFAGGLVNSLFAVQLVMWLERTYELRVSGDDLDFANFRSVSAIAEFVRRKAPLAGGHAWTSD
jgi:methoxymalonate biosynthesis acyl carrier protein